MLRTTINGLNIRFSFDHVLGMGQEVGLKGVSMCRLVVHPSKDDPWPAVDPKTEFYGQAYCSALDIFDKAKGRKLALARALDSAVESGAELTKQVRTEVWNRYHSRRLTNAQYDEVQVNVA